MSRLSDQSKVLAQRLALLEERLRQQAATGSDDEPATAPTVPAPAQPVGERETVSARPRRRRLTGARVR